MDFTAFTLVQEAGGGALAPNESTHVSVGAKHHLENPWRMPFTLIEVQCGNHVCEVDVERFDDIYGRVSMQGDSSNKAQVARG
jgi:hypothetical protein